MSIQPTFKYREPQRGPQPSGLHGGAPREAQISHKTLLSSTLNTRVLWPGRDKPANTEQARAALHLNRLLSREGRPLPHAPLPHRDRKSFLTPEFPGPLREGPHPHPRAGHRPLSVPPLG